MPITLQTVPKYLSISLWVSLLLVSLVTVCYAQDATAPGYNRVRDEGTNVTRRRNLNMVGAGVSCADDSSNGETDCTISGGGSGNSFETIAVPAGASVVAESSADTLTLTSTGVTLTLTGTAATDTINLEAIDLTCADCLNATEIDDIYVLNSSDTMSCTFRSEKHTS